MSTNYFLFRARELEKWEERYARATNGRAAGRFVLQTQATPLIHRVFPDHEAGPSRNPNEIRQPSGPLIRFHLRDFHRGGERTLDWYPGRLRRSTSSRARYEMGR